MKKRSTSSDKLDNSELHRQRAQRNECGDDQTPARPAHNNGAATTEKLAGLAQEFHMAHEELKQKSLLLQAAYTRSVGEVIKLGNILIEVKKATKAAKLSWMGWVDENTTISQKTVSRWMHVAKNSTAMSSQTVTHKNLTKHYEDIGILKPKSQKSKSDADQTPSDATTNNDGKPAGENDAAETVFNKAKHMADRLAQLAVQTSDQERMAEAIKSIIAWHDEYLEMKMAAKQKAEQDAEFDNQISTTA